MPEPSDLPPRPLPARRPVAGVAAWVAWFGVGRMAVAALSVLIVVAGGYWLVRAPAPATEAGLPFASTTTTSTATSTATSSITSTATATGTATPAIADPAATGDLRVHVAGAVARPGVYELPPAAHAQLAVDRAGGFAEGADPDGLNLAAPLVDGERLYVPFEGEIDPADVPSLPAANAATGDAAATAGPIDLNRADPAQLETLPGVGPATALAIVDDRERNGPFASVDDLDRVPGIGPARLEALRELVRV